MDRFKITEEESDIDPLSQQNQMRLGSAAEKLLEDEKEELETNEFSP
jgi:hypothetical protein